MPELPEVETIVRELAPRLEGHRIERVELRKSDVLRRVTPRRLLGALRQNSFVEVHRRAKHAVFRLSSGHRLVIQPRMTGSLMVYERPLTRDEKRYAVLVCRLDLRSVERDGEVHPRSLFPPAERDRRAGERVVGLEVDAQLGHLDLHFTRRLDAAGTPAIRKRI